MNIPTYLLNDYDLEVLLNRAIEVMTELAGEQDTAELPPFIEALRAELASRVKVYVFNEDEI